MWQSQPQSPFQTDQPFGVADHESDLFVISLHQGAINLCFQDYKPKSERLDLCLQDCKTES